MQIYYAKCEASSADAEGRHAERRASCGSCAAARRLRRCQATLARRRNIRAYSRITRTGLLTMLIGLGLLAPATTRALDLTGGNNAEGAGGGIFNLKSALTMSNCTVSGNPASDRGGGILNRGMLTMTATFVAGNTALVFGPDFDASVNSGGYNLIGDGTGSSGFTGPGDQVGTAVAPIDPLLGPLADNGGPTLTHALLLGSPAIDAGISAGATVVDQRGRPRAFDLPGAPNAAGGNGTDIGAFELDESFSVDSDVTVRRTATTSARATRAKRCPVFAAVISPTPTRTVIWLPTASTSARASTTTRTPTRTESRMAATTVRGTITPTNWTTMVMVSATRAMPAWRSTMPG